MTPREPLPFRESRAPLPVSTRDLPSLPASARALLEHGLAGLRLSPTAGAHAALEDHVRLLLAWTEHINLTAIRDPDRVAREHLLDSLAAVPLLQAGGVRRFLDLGSGGGFPGLPIAVAIPDSEAILVESVAKKARFLQVAVDAVGLSDRVAVVNGRAEELAPGDGSGVPVQAVCVRAVADLATLARLAAPLLVPGGWLVAWKRGDVGAEISAADAELATHGFGRPQLHAVEVEGLEDHRLVVAPLLRAARLPGRRRHRRW